MGGKGVRENIGRVMFLKNLHHIINVKLMWNENRSRDIRWVTLKLRVGAVTSDIRYRGLLSRINKNEGPLVFMVLIF